MPKKSRDLTYSSLILCVGSGVLKSVWRLTVRQLRRALVLIGILLAAGVSQAQMACFKVHSRAPRETNLYLQKLDDQANRRAFSQWNFPKQAFDIATMGLFAEVMRLETASDGTVSAHPVLAKIEAAKKRYAEKMQSVTNAEQIEALNLLAKAIPHLHADQESVVIRASLVRMGEKNEIETALLHRYQLMGFKVADFIYRLSGLEKDEVMTGATMMDESVSILKQRRGYNIHLAFDTQIWMQEGKLVASYLKRLRSAQAEDERQAVLQELASGVSPFQPYSGVVTTDVFYSQAKPTEIKRYVRNPYEDLLGLTNPLQKDENKVRIQMLYQVISTLDDRVSLEVHAHQLKHVRYYTRLGFAKTSEIHDPLYPDATVHVLTGSKQSVLQKLKEILDKHVASDGSP